MNNITEKIVSALWVMCVLATCSGEALGGCQYQLSQCYGQMRGMEQRLNLMETQQNRMVGRQSAVTQAVTRGISNLDQDTKTVKSVLNTLVKENVNMHGDISLLKGYGDDIVGLRRQVNGVKQTMWGQLTDVRGKIDDVSQHLGQNANAQTKVTVLMSTQMERNKQLLQGIQAQSSGLESKMKKVEKQMSSSNVHGMMDELTGRIDSLQNDYDQQLKELTNKLKNFKK